MITGQEHLSTLEKLQKKQTRIYSDAADYGIDLSHGKNSDTLEKIQNALNYDNGYPEGLLKTYNHTRETWGNKRAHGVQVNFFVPYEKINEFFHGVYVTISYNTDKKNVPDNKFVSIDIHRGTKSISYKPYNII